MTECIQGLPPKFSSFCASKQISGVSPGCK